MPDSTARFLMERHEHMAKPLETGDLVATATGDFSRRAENSPKLRVLVVDDEPLIRWSLAETLEQAGHTVSEAPDGASAVRAVEDDDTFDVVVLDYRLPDSNDLRLLKAIRSASPPPAVVMMTAFGAPEIAAGALALGAYCVVPKPFEVHDVAALVLQAHQTDRHASQTHVQPLGGGR